MPSVAKGRAPVLVGAGQVKQRVEDPREGREPLELMAEAARRAAEDCGAPGILARANSIRVPKGLWHYANPAALLRERFGAPPGETVTAPISGNSVQRMISDAALEIVDGRLDVVVVAGGEAERSKRRAKRAGIDLAWTEQSGPEPDKQLGSSERLISPEEIRAKLFQPAATFSLYENALRAEQGLSLEAHRQKIGALWARFSEVAAGNPEAWSRDPLSADEISTPSGDNRYAAFPYTKRLCSNMVVDMGAAVILCAAEVAERMGVPRDRWVYLHAATDAQKVPLLSNREDLHSAPAIRIAGARALELAGVQPEQLDHVDVYSCFPSAVQLAANELGLPLDRALTVTGGLSFGGGPFNSYVLHSTAAMMDRLRAEPGTRGLVTSLGGWLSKYAFAVYSTEPPASGFAHADLDGALAGVPTRDLEVAAVGPARVETYALQYLEGRATTLSIACRRDDGRRAWAISEEPSLLEGAAREELCGRDVVLSEDGAFDVV